MKVEAKAIVKGDSKSYSISAASIVAKVYRDNLMEEMALKYPYYGFEKNAGYGTKEHMEALSKYGITPEHRTSYAPIKEFLK
jgi:ribonuclease HII